MADLRKIFDDWGCWWKRWTFDQAKTKAKKKARKLRVYGLSAGRSEACPKDALDFEPTASTTPKLANPI